MYNKKYALITGAAGLLGPQHAEALAEIDFHLVLIDIEKNKLNTIYKRLRKKFTNTNIYPYICDIRSEKVVKKLQKKLEKNKIFIDVLINNAEVNPKMNTKNTFTGLIENYNIKRLHQEINVGIVGTFICSKIFGSKMAKKKGGVIINISSDLGINAPDHRVYHSSEKIEKVKNFKPIGYSISKHAISGITKYLATYWAHKNVRCNTLVSGAVLSTQSKSLIKNIKKRVPMNRLGNVNEYKSAIQFLASDSSNYMTGQNLIMDGGRTIW